MLLHSKYDNKSISDITVLELWSKTWCFNRHHSCFRWYLNMKKVCKCQGGVLAPGQPDKVGLRFGINPSLWRDVLLMSHLGSKAQLHKRPAPNIRLYTPNTGLPGMFHVPGSKLTQHMHSQRDTRRNIQKCIFIVLTSMKTLSVYMSLNVICQHGKKHKQTRRLKIFGRFRKRMTSLIHKMNLTWTTLLMISKEKKRRYRNVASEEFLRCWALEKVP